MSCGYRGNPGLTARAYRAGWYVTGDLGRLDDEGLLHILGRAVDVQDLDGTLVTPTGIEEALCGLHSVRYAVVVRDPEAGLTIAAVITWEGLSIDNRECRQIIADRFGIPPLHRSSWFKSSTSRSRNRASLIVRQLEP
jgi:acyl-coenzyme A synthetase/AMP-(fatty) acid ligase